MMRRLALICSGLALASIPVSLGFAFVSMMLGGRLIYILPTLAIDAITIPINLITITMLSPNRDLLHYPRQVLRYLSTWRERRVLQAEQAVREARPVRRAWNIITSPPHAISDARASRLEGLRFRADIVVDRLTGSPCLGDMDALILMEKTLGEVASAYSDALATATTDRARKALDRRLDTTLEQMVSAAESRLALADKAIADRFDVAINHAQASSERLIDR